MWFLTFKRAVQTQNGLILWYVPISLTRRQLCLPSRVCLVYIFFFPFHLNHIWIRFWPPQENQHSEYQTETKHFGSKHILYVRVAEQPDRKIERYCGFNILTFQFQLNKENLCGLFKSPIWNGNNILFIFGNKTDIKS